MMTRLLVTLSAAAVLCLAASSPAAAQNNPGPAVHPDHMEHRFDNADELAKSFDDPARDAWQMPDRVINELGFSQARSWRTLAPAPATSACASRNCRQSQSLRGSTSSLRCWSTSPIVRCTTACRM